jgi:hypothetical protein
MTNAVRILALAALILCAAPAFAQTTPGQEPPPAAEKGATAQASCIDEDDHYTRNGKQPMFVIELTNKCAQRMTCKVFAYVTSARGAVQGHGTIRLAAVAPGQPTKGNFTMKAKSMGGSSQSDRECRVTP